MLMAAAANRNTAASPKWLCIQPPVNPRKTRKEAPVLLLVPLWILALANIYFGIAADVPFNLARDAAAAAFGAEAFR